MATIWQMAKDIELQDARIYERVARNVPRADLAGVFAALARDEARHWRFLDNIEKCVPAELFASASIEADVREVLEALSADSDGDEATSTLLRDTMDHCSRALTREAWSIEFYQQLRATSMPAMEHIVVDQILSEEERHRRVIEALLDFAGGLCRLSAIPGPALWRRDEHAATGTLIHTAPVAAMEGVMG